MTDSNNDHGKMDDYSILISLLRLLANPDNSVAMGTLREVGTNYKRTEGEGISYGNAIKIGAENIAQLGLNNDIATLSMDEKGNFSTDHNGWETVFSEASPERFLAEFGGGGDGQYSISYNTGKPVVSGYEDESFYMQRVEVNGYTQGYFLSPDKLCSHGIYIGSNEIDFDNLPQVMQNELAKPEEKLQNQPKLEPKTEHDLQPEKMVNQFNFEQ